MTAVVPYVYNTTSLLSRSPRRMGLNYVYASKKQQRTRVTFICTTSRLNGIGHASVKQNNKLSRARTYVKRFVCISPSIFSPRNLHPDTETYLIQVLSVKAKLKYFHLSSPHSFVPRGECSECTKKSLSNLGGVHAHVRIPHAPDTSTS